MNFKSNPLNPKVTAYLERIGYTESLECNSETLYQLQRCHLLTVPYENFDILQGIPLSLELDHLFNKIVIRQRGGYCFEVNALFGWLLRELGYQVTDLFARFWRDESNPPPKCRHQVLLINIDNTSYLCDVGVGGIVPIEPLVLIEGMEQQQDNECYKLERDPVFGWLLCEFKHNQWVRIYSFTEEPQLAKDYTMANFWCEHSPDSIFKKNKMASIRTKEGRNTIEGEEFRIFTSQGVHAFVPQTPDEFNDALLTYFGINLSKSQ